MLKHIAFFIAPFVLILACKTLKKSDTEKKSNQSILFSSIKREYCFGNCPVYELKIFKNGDAIYHGIANTKLQGWYCSKLDKTVLDRLSEKAREINYLNLDSTYFHPQGIDAPYTTTSILINKTFKKVRRQLQYPPKLLSFERVFDEIIESTNWVKKSESGKKDN
ncbi:MAG: hypothetical protein CL844_10020 [Crocinitomicaceae bacterium]|nr:hypothetical protein [Crocinitomicaceae bacterium]|tara:strand:- start:18988 stop:19482 length:495 start_codon:yes stop_codon:yes gene_type:complete